MKQVRKTIRLLIILCFCQYSHSAFCQQVFSIELDTISPKKITGILIEGNHTTKERIILREITFKQGDTLVWKKLQAELEQSRLNLMNTRLFNFVEIETIQLDNFQTLVNIIVRERWYIFPYPIFQNAETNFNTWWKRKDFRRTNYGLYLIRENFRGLNERLSFTARFGYAKKFGITYSTPNLNKKQTLGFDISANYFENAEIVYNTVDNERLFYKEENGIARDTREIKTGISYRKNIFTTHRMEIRYIQSRVRDSVIVLNPEYFGKPAPKIQFPSVNYSFSHDKRDYKPYPLKGFQIYGIAEHVGLGFMKENNGGYFSALAGWRHHIPFSKKINFAYSLKGKQTFHQQVPYYFTGGLGYNDFVRGYEYYVIDGTRYALLKGNLKYEILAPKKINFNFIPLESFSKTFVAAYANIFADAGYVDGGDFNHGNSLAREWLTSVGVGIDFVTYYDLVFRMEYTLNGLGEHGLFLHFKQAL